MSGEGQDLLTFTVSKVLQRCQLFTFFLYESIPAEYSQVGNRQQDQLRTDFTERRGTQDIVDPRTDQRWGADTGNETFLESEFI